MLSSSSTQYVWCCPYCEFHDSLISAQVQPIDTKSNHQPSMSHSINHHKVYEMYYVSGPYTVSINMPLGCLRFQGKNRMSPRVWPGVSRTCISCSPNIQIWPSLSAKSIPGIRSSSALGPTTYPTDIAFITQDNLEHFKFKVLIKRTPECLNLYSIWRERPDRRTRI